MSSTDERLRAIFRERLVPLADELRHRGAVGFHSATESAEADDETWWQPPSDWPDLAECEPGAWAEQLRQHWRRHGLEELLPLADELVQLADELELDEEQSAEVSPYVYVMY